MWHSLNSNFKFCIGHSCMNLHDLNAINMGTAKALPLMLGKCRHPDTLDWSRAHPSPVEDPRQSQGPCRGNHMPEKSYRENTYGVWLLCWKCGLRLQYVPRKGASGKYVTDMPPKEIVEKVLLDTRNMHDVNGAFIRQLIAKAHNEGAPSAVKKGNRHGKDLTTAGTSAARTSLQVKTEKEQDVETFWMMPTNEGFYDLAKDDSEASTSLAEDRWNILVRRLLKQVTGEALMGWA